MTPEQQQQQAATKIQLAWRRNGGIAALAKQLDSTFMDKMKTDEQFPSADPCCMVESGTGDLFTLWLLKLLIRGGSSTDPRALSSRSQEISLCWFIVVLKDQFWPGDDDHENPPLVSAALDLVELLLDLHDGYFESIRELDNEINHFFDELDRWKGQHRELFIPALRRSVVELLHRLLISRPADAELNLKRQIAFFSLLDQEGMRAFLESNVFKAISIASKNEFWRSATISRAKILHEIIIHDGVYSVPVSQSFPRLGQNHGDGGRIVDSPAFRNDVMSCLLSCVNEGDVLEQIADAFYATRGSDTRGFASAIIAVLGDIFRGSATVEGMVEAEWRANEERDPLRAIVQCVCKARNMLDNSAVGYIRQAMNQFISENTIAQPALNLLQIRKTERTGQWIQALLLLSRRDDATRMKALSAGNPFALLEFFNASMLELVLLLPGRNNNNSNEGGAVIDYLSDEHCPEFLCFDRDRLIDIRLDLSMCSPAIKLEHLTELVTADRWMGPSYACTPTVRRSAVILRRVLQLHRYCHGHMLCSMVVDAATAELAMMMVDSP